MAPCVVSACEQSTGYDANNNGEDEVVDQVQRVSDPLRERKIEQVNHDVSASDLGIGKEGEHCDAHRQFGDLRDAEDGRAEQGKGSDIRRDHRCKREQNNAARDCYQFRDSFQLVARL